jgi:hypothetical protein
MHESIVPRNGLRGPIARLGADSRLWKSARTNPNLPKWRHAWRVEGGKCDERTHGPLVGAGSARTNPTGEASGANEPSEPFTRCGIGANEPNGSSRVQACIPGEVHPARTNPTSDAGANLRERTQRSREAAGRRSMSIRSTTRHGARSDGHRRGRRVFRATLGRTVVSAEVAGPTDRGRAILDRSRRRALTAACTGSRPCCSRPRSRAAMPGRSCIL